MERSVDDDSFFLFFKNIPSEENASNVEDKTAAINEQERMRIDYDIARIIIDDIIPFSLEYYLQMVIANDEDSDDEDKVSPENQEKKKFEQQKSNLSKKSKKNSVVFKTVIDSNYNSEGGSSRGVSPSLSPTKK